MAAHVGRPRFGRAPTALRTVTGPKALPGWENFAGFIAHIRFVRSHQQKIERVALVTDSHLASVGEALGKHFTAAEIKHFAFADYEKALSWLKTC